jgi:hypothetical protein
MYVHSATTQCVSKESTMLQCLLSNITAVFETPAKTENQVKKSIVQSLNQSKVSTFNLNTTIPLLNKTS